MENTNRQLADVSGRVGIIERAFFGMVDEGTNQFVPGLLQNTENVAKASAETAGEMKDMKRWMRWAVIVGVALLLVAAFPRLAEAFKIASAVAGM